VADKKVSALTALTTSASPDLLMIIDDPNGTATSKKVTVKNFFGAVPSNTVFVAGSLVTARSNVTITSANAYITANVNVSGISKIVGTGDNARIVIENTTTPGSNNATTQFTGGQQGSIFWDANYLYVATTNTQIKRVALSVFS
jgi:hypothetical protein|tara:strand:- start:15852 stop:16283 length:432 start_codon:yes stop_codon:yes gene_type:complete